jgi:hypothetical protein
MNNNPSSQRHTIGGANNIGNANFQQNQQRAHNMPRNNNVSNSAFGYYQNKPNPQANGNQFWCAPMNKNKVMTSSELSVTVSSLNSYKNAMAKATTGHGNNNFLANQGFKVIGNPGNGQNNAQNLGRNFGNFGQNHNAQFHQQQAGYQIPSKLT